MNLCAQRSRCRSQAFTCSCQQRGLDHDASVFRRPERRLAACARDSACLLLVNNFLSASRGIAQSAQARRSKPAKREAIK